MSSKEGRLTYIVDIDKTIMDTVGSDYLNSRPYLDRIAKINALFDEGHTIIYWTARGGASKINWHEWTVKQLYRAGAKYSELRMGKPSYDLWIDDKALNSEEFFFFK